MIPENWCFTEWSDTKNVYCMVQQIYQEELKEML